MNVHLPLRLASIVVTALVALAPVARGNEEVGDSFALMASTSEEMTADASTPLVLAPSDKPWDLSRFDSIYLKLRNPAQERITVYARAENPTAKGVTDNIRTALVLEAGEQRTMRLRIMRRPEDPGYAPFKPFLMYFKAINVRDNTVDPSQIARIVVWLGNAKPGQSVKLASASAARITTPGPVPFLPFVDRYGQYKHTDWPDKIYADSDFADALKRDQAEMAKYPGPADWNAWGGWRDGPKQKATGFFYPAKVGEQWWLVDPDGCLYWSYGATGVGGGGEGSPVTDKETWFEELPSKDGPYAKYWSKGKGARYMYYQNGKAWESYSFSGANAERKYGPNWREATADAIHSRLRNWGLNSMGNWSDPLVYLRRKTPYVATISSSGPMLEHIPDVFHREWSNGLRQAMENQKGTTANDPWNIGYFVDNEWTWGSSPRGLTVVKNLFRFPGSASKKEFVDDLKANYHGIAALNEAWGTSYDSWDALLESERAPSEEVLTKNERYRADAGNFGMKFAEKYFSTVQTEIKRVAPNNLYLGCRFHGHIDPSIVEVAAKHCDVIGYNIYEMPSGRLVHYKNIDKPFIVGEFGVTSDLGQTPWRGAIYSQEEGERLQGLEKWLLDAFSHRQLVGAHFFQFRDQPLTGRPDGEATLRGFMNVADTPHFDLVQMNRRLAYEMYQLRSGKDGSNPATPQN